MKMTNDFCDVQSVAQVCLFSSLILLVLFIKVTFYND